MEPITSTITVGEPWGKQTVPNITIENAKFWGRPNFAGEINQFRETKRQFTVLIPNDLADQLRDIGYNVKTKMPTPEEQAEGREPISSLKVIVDVTINERGEEYGSEVFLMVGGDHQKLNGSNMGIIDRARIHNVDMELRAWNYNKKEVDAGLEEAKYSARLVTCVAIIERSILGEKYGALI